MKKQNGFLMISLIILVVIIGFLAVMVSYITISGSASGLNLLNIRGAFYTAQAGLNAATYKLSATTAINSDARETCFLIKDMSGAIGTGTDESQFSIVSRINKNYQSTIDEANITADDTSLKVDNAQRNFVLQGGRVIIDHEIIGYQKRKKNTLERLSRGLQGTISAPHNIGAIVSQYQCTITSSGVINPSSPRGTTQLQQAVQMDQAWTGGDRFKKWTGKKWNTVKPKPSDEFINITSISMTSYHNGMAVGQYDATNGCPVTYTWNGATWGLPIYSFSAPVKLNSVACITSKNCWAVGNNYIGTTQPKNKVLILQYDGSSWSNHSFSFSNPDKGKARSLLGISCPVKNDGSGNYECWAVGNKSDENRSSLFHYISSPLPASWNHVVGDNLRKDINAISCTATDDCWAIADVGQLYHYSGIAEDWTYVGNVANSKGTSIDCYKNENNRSSCWVGDADSNVYYCDDQCNIKSNWGLHSTLGTGSNVNGIKCLSKNNCWAILKNGKIHHYNGKDWQERPEDAGSNVFALDAIGSRGDPHSNWKQL